jgi:pyridoxal phosphate enzyme (YggS family)
MAEAYAVGEVLRARYDEVVGRVADAAKRSGRSERDVMLVAVTKFAEPDQVRELLAYGQRDFGENKIQSLVQRAAIVEEYLDRHRVLSHTKAASSVLGTGDVPDAVRWHMIGHLQRNKARKAAECCRLVHTVDSLRLAEELQAIGLKRDTPIDVLVQVNCSGEPQKFGCAPAAAPHLAEQIDTMVFVRVRGLMTMAAETPEADLDARPTFERCRELFEELSRLDLGDGRFNLLSMGMSGDYEAPIEEGANIVRVGSAIFGTEPVVEEESE